MIIVDSSDVVREVAREDSSAAMWTDSMTIHVLALNVVDQPFLRVDYFTTLSTVLQSSFAVKESSSMFHPNMVFQTFLVMKALTTLLALELVHPLMSCFDVFHQGLHSDFLPTLWTRRFPLHMNPKHMPLKICSATKSLFTIPFCAWY